MNKGKNFNLFLMDGEATGRIKCTLANWTGIAYKIPRSYLDRCKDRKDLKNSGVYFLFGSDNANEDSVYIGQAGSRKNGKGVLFRVSEHLKDEFYFTDAVVLTTQNNSFGPTEISYLENRFTKIALETRRYNVQNSNEPNLGNVTEEKESELEDFIEYSKLVLGVMGYKLFVPLIKAEPAITTSDDNKEDELELYLSRKIKSTNNMITAHCKRTSEGFVVLAGSQIEMRDSNSLPPAIKKLRDKCKRNHEIIEGKLTKNYLFKSPSYAASFVIGMTTNGRANWKTKDGTQLKFLEKKGL